MQFYAYRLPDGICVLDMQSNVLSHLRTRLVAPLVPEASERPMAVLEPILHLEGVPMTLLATEMMTVPAKLLRGPPVGQFTDDDYAIRRALDMLFSGF